MGGLRGRPIGRTDAIYFDGGLVLVDKNRSRVFACNKSARLIWSALAEGHPQTDIVGAISQGQGIPVAEVQRAVDRICSQWLAEGLLPGQDLSAPASAPKQPLRRTAGGANWSSEWFCRINGRSFRFAVEPVHLVEPIRLLLRHLEITGGSDADVVLEIRATRSSECVLFENGVELMRATFSGSFKDAIHRSIIRHLNPDVEWFSVVHAGAVARAGEGFAFPAESGSGKTTLIAYLISKGFDYLADDLMPLAAPHATLLPWPLPQSIKSGSWNLLAPFYPDLASIPEFRTKGIRAKLLIPPHRAFDQVRVPLRYIVFPAYHPDAENALTQLTPLETLERLLRGRIWLGYPLRTARVKAFLNWLKEIRSFALDFRSLEEAAERVISIQS